MKLRVRAIVFDMYGTLVDIGAVTEACKEITPDPLAFNNQWRAKQLEYTFLRTLMGRYRDFWKVTEEALEFVIQRFGIQVTSEQRQHLIDAWLHPTPSPRGGNCPAATEGEVRTSCPIQWQCKNASERFGSHWVEVSLPVGHERGCN